MKVGGKEVALDAPPPGIDLSNLDDLPDEFPEVPEIDGDSGDSDNLANPQDEPPAYDDPVDSVAVESEDPDEGSEREAANADDVRPPRKKGRGYDQRIDTLTGEKHALKEDRDYWRDMALRRQSEAVPVPADSGLAQDTPAPADIPEPPAKPMLEDFGGDVDAFTDALSNYTEERVRHEAQVAVATAQQTAIDQQNARDAANREATLNEQFGQRVLEASKNLENYRDIAMNPTVPVTETMYSAIRESEFGPEILYHLGLNPEKAARIAEGGLSQQSMSIGRLEEQVRRKVQGTNKPGRVSSAPPPPSTSGQSDSATRNPAKMDDETYRKWRQSGGGARRD